MNTKKFLSLVILVCLCVIAFAGCSSTSTSTSESTTGEPESISQPTSVSGSGDTSAPEADVDPLTGATDEMMLKSIQVVLNRADPHRGNDLPQSMLIENLYDTLVKVDADGNVVNSMAESWEVADDGLSVTFTIKKGILFHDGTEVLASDVVFSMDRMLALGEGYAYLFSAVDYTEALDDYTVVFHLKNLYAPFVSTLIRLAIANEDLVSANTNKSVSTYGENGDYGYDFLLTNDAGCGPYTIVEWVPSDHVLLDKFDDYFKGWEPGSPEAVRLIMVEGTGQVVTVQTMMANGEADVSLPDISTEDAVTLSATPGVKVGSASLGTVMYLMYNTKKPPTDDRYFRMALNYMMDYETAAKDAYLNASPALSIVPMGLAGSKAPTNVTYEYNMDKAAEYLAMSKYADNLDEYPVDFTYNNSLAANKKIAMMLQASAAQLGVTVEVTEAPWVTITDKAASVESTMNVTAIQVAPSFWEAGSQLEARFSTATQGTWQNTEWLGDVTIDNMIADAFGTINDTERYEKYGKIIDYVSDLYSCAPLVENSSSAAYKYDRISWPLGDKFIETGEKGSVPMGYEYSWREWKIRSAVNP